jgi:hypothetical protein
MRKIVYQIIVPFFVLVSCSQNDNFSDYAYGFGNGGQGKNASHGNTSYHGCCHAGGQLHAISDGSREINEFGNDQRYGLSEWLGGYSVCGFNVVEKYAKQFINEKTGKS